MEQSLTSAFEIPRIPGMVSDPNHGAQGGMNYRLPNGWVVTVRGNPKDPQALVFISHRQGIRNISDIIACADQRQSDEKRFLSRSEIRELFTTLAKLDSSGAAPKAPASVGLSSSAKKAVAITAASITAGALSVYGLGKYSERVVPEGSIGLKDTPSRMETVQKVRVVPPGHYLYGGLRFPDLRTVELGASHHQQIDTTLTPSTISKMKVAAQKSLIARQLPLVGDAVKNAESQHLQVKANVTFKIPESAALQPFLERISSSNFERDIDAACRASLATRAGQLNRRYFKPDMDKVNQEIGQEIAQALGLPAVEVQITKVERTTLKDKDFAAVRDAKRAQIGTVTEGVAEVLFELVTAGLH